MPWYCMDCRKRFDGPTNRSPESGCAHCSGRQIFDINASPVNLSTGRLN